MAIKLTTTLVQQDSRKSISEFITGTKFVLHPDNCSWVLHLLHDATNILIIWLLDQLIKEYFASRNPKVRCRVRERS
jgi:hypothetical protein